MLKRIGKSVLIKLIVLSGIVKLRRYFLQRANVTIFILHDPGKDDFKAILTALNARYNFVSMEEFIRLKKQGKLAELPKNAAVLTFDDGHKNNYALLDTIVAQKTPTTIYVCSDIINTNRHFWSNYNMPKAKMEANKRLPNKEMLANFKEVGYEKEKEYPERQALSLEEIKRMQESGFVTFESHTCFHPILTNLSDEESKLEIEQSKHNLEALLKKEITGFAFPNGDYGPREINFVKEANYEYSVTVQVGTNNQKTDNYKLKRICLNDFGSVDENIIKASGLWEYLKQ